MYDINKTNYKPYLVSKWNLNNFLDISCVTEVLETTYLLNEL